MDEPLKQRLVGAVVLALLAVVFVPFLLGEPSLPDDETNELRRHAPRPTPRPVPALPIAVVEQPAPAHAPESTAAHALVPTLAPSSESGWVVQLATFSNEDNARTLERQLSGLQSTVTVERYGEYWRVVVGPFGSRESATKILGELERRTRLRGVIRKV